MSIFKKMNRKQRRQFDKLNQEEKNQIIAHEISEKIKETTQKQIALSFIRGTEWVNKIYYEKYVLSWDAAKYDSKRKKVAKELIEEIRMHYEKAVERGKTKDNKIVNQDQVQEQEEK